MTCYRVLEFRTICTTHTPTSDQYAHTWRNSVSVSPCPLLWPYSTWRSLVSWVQFCLKLCHSPLAWPAGPVLLSMCSPLSVCIPCRAYRLMAKLGLFPISTPSRTYKRLGGSQSHSLPPDDCALLFCSIIVCVHLTTPHTILTTHPYTAHTLITDLHTSTPIIWWLFHICK